MIKSKTKNYINKLQVAFYKAGITVFDSFLIFGVFCIFYFLIKTKIRQWSYIRPPAPEGVDANSAMSFIRHFYDPPIVDWLLCLIVALTACLILSILTIAGFLANRVGLNPSLKWQLRAFYRLLRKKIRTILIKEWDAFYEENLTPLGLKKHRDALQIVVTDFFILIIICYPVWKIAQLAYALWSFFASRF